MAVYYKFKSARDYDSIPMDGPFISLGTLKDKIFESKHLDSGKDFDLVVTNAQTNEEYPDEATLIPKNTSVLIRRVPGRPRLPIVTEQESRMENKPEDAQPVKSGYSAADSSALSLEDLEWDEFGNDLYSIPEMLPIQSSDPVPEASVTTREEEENKIKALIDTPALDWQKQGLDGFGAGKGFGRGMSGRTGGRGFARVGLERKPPPPGYVCHRCKTPGHFIQHCPTNGDPNYDIKRVKPPTGIPKSMLMATPDGSYALPSGAVAVLKPNEDAFEKAVKGLPSTRSIGELPPELHCPLCMEVMKDAALTSKCCFKSFCDRCIRNYIISKSMCVCGATDILADDLLPNKTLRDTINRILESGTNSTENAGSAFQVQDMASARCPPPKLPSPCTSAASKGEEKPVTGDVEEPKVKAAVEMIKPISAPQSTKEVVTAAKKMDAFEAESMSLREATSRASVPIPEEEVQQKLNPGEQGKKKKKKKARVAAPDMQWNAPQDLAADYMMPMAPSAFNPFWGGVQPGLDGFMGRYPGPMPYMGYGPGPLDMPPFGGVMPPGPFGPQGFMFPPMPPHRDLAELGMGVMNMPPPVMSREEFEARKADLRRKRENEKRSEREFSRDREYGRDESGDADIWSMKSKPKNILPSASGEHRHVPERPTVDRPGRDPEPPPRPSKRRSEHRHDYHEADHHRRRERSQSHDRGYERHLEPHCDRDDDRHRHHHHRHHCHHHQHHRLEPSSLKHVVEGKSPSEGSTAGVDKKHKGSVFSRISYPEGEVTGEKGKVSSSQQESRYESAAEEYESSDEDRHFKRKPSRYEPSPPPAGVEWEDKDSSRHSKASRDMHCKHRY